MSDTLIAFTLSNGSSCYGRQTGKPGIWWLRHTSDKVSDEYNDAAPIEARQQAEAALAAGGWELGGVIEVEVKS